MFYLTHVDPLVGIEQYEVRNSRDELIAVYGPNDRDRAELVVRTLNSEYEATREYFA